VTEYIRCVSLGIKPCYYFQFTITLGTSRESEMICAENVLSNHSPNLIRFKF